MAVRKSGGKKKAARKKAGRKKAASRSRATLASRTRRAIDRGLRDLERELPRELESVLHEIRTGVTELERQIEHAWEDGEARWQQLEKEIRKDSEQMLKRFGIGSKKKGARKKKASRKKTARKKTARKKSSRKKATRKGPRR